MTGGFRESVNAVRRQYGLPALSSSVTAHSGTLPLYTVPSAPEFDFERRDLPPSVHYVGPLFRQLPPTERAPAWVAGLPTDRPWIYATEGTVHVSEPLVLRSAARGLANLPMEVILISGDDRDPREIGLDSLAPNVHLDRWVPYPAVMPHTRVVITTGGPGSVLAALCAGVPVIVVPTEWDKPDIAQRVVSTGAGLSIPPRRCTPRRLRAAVERVLADPSFRRNAERMARIFARYPGAPRAAELLESLAPAAQRSAQPTLAGRLP
jgi:MGT family glycosyltransferase